MARKPRTRSSTGIHHVMNRGVDRNTVFFDDRDRLDFGRRLADLHERFGVTTLAYCLMGNHYHLLLDAPGDNLSRAMQHLGTTVTLRTNARQGRDGPLFRGRFYSKPVESDAYLLWLTRYIHRNPLDFAGVHNLAAYRWSSYRTYLGMRASPSFLDIDTVLDRFARSSTPFRDFTEGDLESGCRWSATDLRQLVELKLAERELDISPYASRAPSDGTSARARPPGPKTLMTLLRHALRDHPIATDIDAHLSSPNAAARMNALRRARAKAASDSSVSDIVNEIAAMFTPRRATGPYGELSIGV